MSVAAGIDLNTISIPPLRVKIASGENKGGRKSRLVKKDQLPCSICSRRTENTSRVQRRMLTINTRADLCEGIQMCLCMQGVFSG